MSWSGVGAQVGTMLGESHPVATIPPLAMDAEAVGCVAKRVCLKQGKIGSGTFATVFAYSGAASSGQVAVKRSREGTLAGGIESPAIKELAFLTELQASQAVVPLAPGVLDADAELAGSHRRASGAASRALDSGAFVHKRQLYLVMEPRVS
ncbi:hypothetical protein FNF28_02818 [Cafeteria roenbergensis]|uniref:Protein kinase domain-containing protein n=1 Tax=Cafeteria roenbergensis TaxID=33653 RepID=A0A5A8DSD3_CAFRO|nr:hypothetical protein FNF28_02818 [Cafeteria roenbergensis]